MRFASTQMSALKRPLKRVKNLFRDPLPRNRELVFEGFELNFPEISYTFSSLGKKYHSKVFIDLPLEQLARLDKAEHRPLFINLGLAFVTSHFLLSDFATVRIACAKLNSHQSRLLESHFQETLTEFRYLLGLDPVRAVKVTSSGTIPMVPISFNTPEEKALLLNGGGKDSCVSAELLKGIGLPFAWLNAFPNAPRSRVMEASGTLENYSIRFFVSEEVKKDAVYPWGVQPYIYAITAASLIVAYLSGFKYIVSGAEHSANDPNLVFNGVEVNHQAGKTSQSEEFFSEFTKIAVLQEVEIFSIARPFTDLRLGEMFSYFPQYFSAFFSCNVGMGTDIWCNNCHKCAFTYLAFYPFFDLEDLKKIFGAQLFELPMLRKFILELTTSSIKPWECVGTVEESKLALFYSLQKSPDMEFAEWPRRRDLENACKGLDPVSAHTNTMSTFLRPHRIPSAYESLLKDYADKLVWDDRSRSFDFLK